MMKKFLSVSTLAFVLGLNGVSLAAAQAPATGGFTGPTIAAITVEQAKQLSDDTPVVLTGKIEKSLGDEKYQFSDQTGSITLDIDNEDWNGVMVNEKDTVEVRGEIDKDMFSLEVDVDQIIKK